MATLLQRQQVDAERLALRIAGFHANQRSRQTADRGHRFIEGRPRHRDQLGFQLSIRPAQQQPRIEAHRADRERRLPIDLKADHVAQALGGGRGQQQAAPQHPARRQQQPARQRGQAIAENPLQFRFLQRQWQAGQVAQAFGVLPLHPQFFLVARQQQAILGQAHQYFPAGRQPADQCLPPPVEKAARAAAIAAESVGKRRAVVERGHRGAAASSQRSVVYTEPGTGPPPARTVVRKVA